MVRAVLGHNLDYSADFITCNKVRVQDIKFLTFEEMSLIQQTRQNRNY